jgi:hypothetical protein
VDHGSIVSLSQTLRGRGGLSRYGARREPEPRCVLVCLFRLSLSSTTRLSFRTRTALVRVVARA